MLRENNSKTLQMRTNKKVHTTQITKTILIKNLQIQTLCIFFSFKYIRSVLPFIFHTI